MTVVLATKFCGTQQNITDIHVKFLILRILTWQQWLSNNAYCLFFIFIFFWFQCCKFRRTKIMVVVLALANKSVDMVYPQYLKAKGKEILACSMERSTQ